MTDSVESGALEKLRAHELADGDDAVDSADNAAAPTRAGGCWSKMTLEPAFAGAMMAIFMGQTSLQNLYLKTACSVDLKFPMSVCERGVGEEFKQAEIASQELVSHVNVSRGFVGALLSTVVLMFMGPWSDCSRRRKPLIVMSLLGMCVTSFNVLVMLTFPGLSTVWVLYLVQIPMSIGGNFGLLLAAGFSYIGDVCHASGRNVTMTMGRNRAAVQCASVLGSLAGPLLFRYVGFYGVFPLVFSLQASALVFVLWRVRDVQVNTANKVSPLDVRLPVAAVRCLVAPRPHHRRKVVLLMLLVAIADRAILAAEVQLWYMYARNKFGWDDVTFGGYLAYRNIVSFFGTLLILRLFKARLRLSDESIGAMSGVSLAASTACLAAAPTTLAVFFVPLVAILAQGSQVVQRPIVNKQIEPTEQGKIYSVVSALEQACQTAISPLFALLYERTAAGAPDAWLVPCGAAACLQLAAYVLAWKLARDQASAPAKPIDEPDLPATHATELNDLKLSNKTSEPEQDYAADKEINKHNHERKIEPLKYEEVLNNNCIESLDTIGSGMKRVNPSVNESNENLKKELDEELKSILKAVDESLLEPSLDEKNK